jgi:hypothetical protein
MLLGENRDIYRMILCLSNLVMLLGFVRKGFWHLLCSINPLTDLAYASLAPFNLSELTNKILWLVRKNLPFPTRCSHSPCRRIRMTMYQLKSEGHTNCVE